MKRYKRKYCVAVEGFSTVVLAETKAEATEKGVRKLYGNRCFWFANSGVPGYGQVFESLRPTRNNSQPGNTSRTNQCRLDVDSIGNPSNNFLKQYRADQAEKAETLREMQEEDDRRYQKELEDMQAEGSANQGGSGMTTIWILDDNSEHIATISGPGSQVMEYAELFYAESYIDSIGPNCANARFDLNPNAEEVSL